MRAISCCSTVLLLTDSDMRRMEEWNRHALVSLQEQLKLYAIMNTGLLNKLQKAAVGFMNRAECTSGRE